MSSSSQTHKQPVLAGAALRAELARALPLDARWQAPEAVSVAARTGSTNADLIEFAARAGIAVPERMLRAAREQDAGRGRLARAWSTPADASLAMSVGVRSALAPAALGGFALMCGLAVHAALADFGIQARLKWPNDIVVATAGGTGYAKLGGILVELAALPARRTWVVIGIGINLRGAAELSAALGRPVADLAQLGAAGVDPNLLVARIVARFEERFERFVREGFGAHAAAFDAVHAFHGHAVELRTATASGHAGAVLRGVCTGVGPGGELLLRQSDGRVEKIISGEVSLAAAGG